MTEKSRVSAWFSILPTLAKERPYGFLDMLAVQIIFGIAAWYFLLGGLVGLYIPASWAIITIIFGNQFPLYLISLTSLYSARYGVDQWIASRAILGYRFNDIILILFYLGSSAGWIAYAALLTGYSVQKINLALQGPSVLSDPYWGPVIVAVIAILLGWYHAYRGPKSLIHIFRVGAIFLLVVLGYLMYYILVTVGTTKVFTMAPPHSVVEDFGVPPDMAKNWALALTLEWNVGLGFSWAFWYGQWTRLAKTETAAYHGTLWGWGLMSVVAGVFPAMAALVINSSDPTDWFVAMGTGYAYLGLVLFAVANITAIMTLIYPLSITTVSRFPRLKWSHATMIFAISGILVSVIPGVFQNYGTYLTIISLICGVYGALMTGGYLLTRGNLSIVDMFNMNKSSKYHYKGGFSIPAVVATIIGIIFYVITLNPFTFQSMDGLFPYITAGMPTYLLTLAIFLLLSMILKQSPPREF